MGSKDKNTLHLPTLPDSAITQSTFPIRITIARYEQRPQGANFPLTESCELGGCFNISLDRGDARQFPGFGNLWLPLDFPKICQSLWDDQEGRGSKLGYRVLRVSILHPTLLILQSYRLHLRLCLHLVGGVAL